MNKTNPQQNYVTRAVAYRGSVLNECIYLENAISFYIINYLLGTSTDGNLEKHFEMQELLLDRMTFEAKRTTLKAILNKKSIAAGFVKNKSTSYPHSDLIHEIRRLNDHRNYFAHYLLYEDASMTEEDMEKIGLIEFRDTSKVIWYTEKEFLKLTQEIQEAYKRVEALDNPNEPHT